MLLSAGALLWFPRKPAQSPAARRGRQRPPHRRRVRRRRARVRPAGRHPGAAKVLVMASDGTLDPQLAIMMSDLGGAISVVGYVRSPSCWQRSRPCGSAGAARWAGGSSVRATPRWRIGRWRQTRPSAVYCRATSWSARPDGGSEIIAADPNAMLGQADAECRADRPRRRGSHPASGGCSRSRPGRALVAAPSVIHHSLGSAGAVGGETRSPLAASADDSTAAPANLQVLVRTPAQLGGLWAGQPAASGMSRHAR